MKGYIFDMDGTIVNNMDYHYKAWNIFLERHHIFLDAKTFEEKNTGTIDEIIKRIFGNHLSPQQVVELGNEKEGLYRELYKNEVVEIDGFISFIQDAHKKGIKLALATMANVHNTAIVVDALGIRQYFTAIITGENVQHGKPNPAVFFTAMKAMGLTHQEVVIFEDSPSGIAAAIASQAKVVGVCTHFTEAECISLGVDYAITNYTNMPAFD